MANLSNINDLFEVESTGAIKFSNQSGTSGQVLKSNGNAAPTWVDASTIIGGPFLPLTGGTLTGNLAISGSNSLTVGGALSGSTATFSGLVSGITPTAAANFATKAYVDAAAGVNTTWPNVGAGVRTNYTLGFKPPTSNYAGFLFQTSAAAHAGYFLIRGASDAGQIYKAEGITLVSDASWLTLASRTTTNAGVRLMSGATSAERLVIKDDGDSYFTGDLGIGATDPVKKLDVRGQLAISNSASSYWYMDRNDTSGSFEIFDDGNTNRLTIDTSGNVIVGDTSGTSPNSADRFLKIGKSNIQDCSIILQDAVETWEIYQNDDLQFSFGTTPTTVMTMQRTTGNVGIGATSPNEKLVLRETSNNATTTLKVEGGSYGFELSKTHQSADYVHLKPRSSSISVLRVMPNSTNADSYMEVWGSDYDSDTSNWNRAYMHLAASTGNFHIKTSSSGNRPVGNLILGTNSTPEAVTILNNGNVGFSDTSPNLKLTVNGAIQRKNKRGNTGKHSLGHYDRGEAIWELDPTMSSQEIADLFGGTTSTVYWDQTSGQSSLAPGGWCLYLSGGVYVGGVYNSGFPYLPVETDSPTQADYYMECYIQNVGTDQRHYMGSNEFNQSFSSLGGHPGSYGYWVMSNTNPGNSWTKVSGYIGGFSASTVGTFENGTKYWTPMALFNYGAGSGTRACRISGWKVYKVYQKGNRKLAGTLDVNSNINSETGYVRKSGVTSGGYIELGSLPGYGANAYQSLTSGGTIHFANNGKYCGYFEGADTYFGILNQATVTKVFFATGNQNSYLTGNGSFGIGTTAPNKKLTVYGGNDNGIWIDSQGAQYTSLAFGNNGTEKANIAWDNTNGYTNISTYSSGHLAMSTGGGIKAFLNSSGNFGIGTTSPTAKLHVSSNGTQARFQSSVSYSDILFTSTAGSNFVNFSSANQFLLYQNGGSASNITTKIDTSGNATFKGDVIAYGSPSDIRLKENIKPIESALDKVSKLNGVTFDWKEKAEDLDKEGNPIKLQQWKHDIGFIAQDVQKVIPELVRENKDGMLSMRHQGIAPILLEAIKELEARVKELENK